MKRQILSFAFILSFLTLAGRAQQLDSVTSNQAAPGVPKQIKAYCIDFNWVPTHRRGKPFAKPGMWAGADPAQHVAWYKAMGANVIQTFAVSTNGYAWYKNGFVPEQPGLKHDFLPEMVKLGHQEGMLVFGYFCAASNPKWGKDHPDLSYGTPTTYHIPYTDEYLDYLSKSIYDAVTKTGMDGFMVDWVWMPRRKSTNGKWLDCEKKLYQQLMGKKFPGENALTKEEELAYNRKALARCWEAIHTAAKKANPDCIIWLTVNNIKAPDVVNSVMYKQADWLMNEAGSVKAIDAVRKMIGEKTRLITCLAAWNGADAVETVPRALASGVGLYGFTAPRNRDGLVPLDAIFSKQISELSGDSRNIAVLARIYNGMSMAALWEKGKFVEPANPPPLRIRLAGRGRGRQDTATMTCHPDSATMTVTTPYNRGRGWLTRTAKQWPARVVIQLQKRPGEAAAPAVFTMSGGDRRFTFPIGNPTSVTFTSSDGKKPVQKGSPIAVNKTETMLQIVVPKSMTSQNPESLSFQWDQK